MSAPVKLNESSQIAKPSIAELVRTPVVPSNPIDTMVSLDPQAEDSSSWKAWLAKLPGCVGDFFAWLFGIKKEGAESIPVNTLAKPSNMEVQAKAVKECLDIFEKGNPDTTALTKAREAFGQLHLKAKLEVIQKLQSNPNCTHAHLLVFVKLCPAGQLYGYIEAHRPVGDLRKGADILEANTKDPAVVGGVKAFIVAERNKADEERQKKILANYAGPDFPPADVCRSSLDCFIAIEGNRSKAETLQLLMGRDNISDAHVVQFAATLPARPKVAKPDTAPAEPEPVEPVLLRDVLFDKLKAQFGQGEAMEQAMYAKAAATAQRLKVQLSDPAPTKFERLEDYFAARHNNLRIRQGVDNALAATLKEIVV